MAKAELESQFPGVVFIDPGAYCSGLLEEDNTMQERKLSVIIKGDVISSDRVTEFAQSYLGSDFTGM